MKGFEGGGPEGQPREDRGVMTAEDLILRARGLSAAVAPDLPPEKEAGKTPEKAHVDALLAQMRRDGLLAAVVPETFGGPGLSVGDLARITFEIATQSGSAGLIYAMHISQAYAIVRHGRGAFFEALQRRMVTAQLLIASGTSEKGPGGDILRSICQVEPDGAGFKIIKESPNISYIDHADLILVSANHDQPRKRQVLVAADVSPADFIPGPEAGFLGMRGIQNRPWAFTARFGEAAIFPEDFGVIARRSMTPSIQIVWAAMWSGLAWSAIDKAKRFVTEEIEPGSEIAAVTGHELSRLIDRHHLINAMLRDAIAVFDAGDAGRMGRDMGFGLAAQINRLKIEASEMVVDIIARAMGLIGIRAYAMGGPYSLAAAMADALSAPVMVSNYRLAMNNAKVERFVDERL